MKPIIIIVLLLVSKTSFSQSYKYYFLEIRPTGKAEVAVIPENSTLYPDIDSLVCERSETRNKETVKEKRYSTYSEMFNKLSSSGLEFVQFATVPKVGGATQLLAGSQPATYMVWRKIFK